MPTIAPDVRIPAARTAAGRTRHRTRHRARHRAPEERAPENREPRHDDRVLTGTRCLLVAFTLLTALATHQLLVHGRRT